MKKILLLLCTLLGTVGAGATQYTITYGTTTGTFYNGSGSAVTSGWVAKWVSNEEGKPKVTLTASANNINAENGRMAPGSSQTSTYTLYVEGGYKVTGFSMNCPTFGAQVTVTPTGESATVVSTGETLVVNSSAASFVYSGNNSGRIQAGSNDSGSFTITVEEEDWAPSITGAFLTVGDKVTSFTAATAADDNDHWYILTQVRDAETPMYNTGAVTEQLKRASSPFTLSSLDGALTSTNSAYLIRFKSVGEGTYNIQFANGYWIDGSLRAANFNTAGTYAFYNCNGGSGSYFAWNINNKSGQKVDNNGAGNTVAFWGSGEVSGTSGNNVWYMYETEVYVPASTINVTYAQYVDGVATGTTSTETVLPNSAINVPSSFYTGYSSLAYDYSTTGIIADEDVTIQVNINKKSAVKLPAELSNSKKYRLVCERGGLSTYYDEANSRTVLASPVKTALGVAAKEFAILNYDSKYYLYSVSDSKFVTYQEEQIAPLANLVTGTSDAIAFSQTTNSVYVIRFDGDANKNINSSATYTYGIAINNWGSYQSDWDGGCQYIIEEAGDFDATTQLAALEDFFHGTTAFNNAIAQLETYPYGTGLNQYSLIVEPLDYTSQASTIISGLKTQGYSADNLAVAQELIAGTSLNMPTAGFYRIKSVAHNTYLSGDASTVTGGTDRLSFTSTTDASNIFYFDGTYLYDLKNGRAANGRAVGTAGATGLDYSFEASSSELGQYVIRFNPDGKSLRWLYAWGDGKHYADQNGSEDANCRFTLEAVTTLPVTVTAAEYATLYSPVALTIPSDVKAYYISSVSSTEATLTEITTTIPAATPVILMASAGNYNFEQAADVDAISGNKLSGTLGGVSVAADEAYTLQRNAADTQTGLFPKAAGTIAGFKAYLLASELEAGVKGLVFKFVDTTTGVSSVKSEAQDNVIFDLSGRRVSKAVKGIYIVNGKKVVK